jgi:methylated-DNA-protein-cysteine methyltransferase related protein
LHGTDIGIYLAVVERDYGARIGGTVTLPSVAEFESAVRAVLARLPPGDTYSYGWVAAEAGYPGRARAVGALLASGGDDVPWWRVVRSDGHLVPHLARTQAALLRKEGVETVKGRLREHPNHVPR